MKRLISCSKVVKRAFQSNFRSNFYTYWHDDEGITFLTNPEGNQVAKEGFTGEANLTNIKEEIYSGFFENGLKHGYGTYTYDNGDYFEGNWENDMRNGEGKLTFSNSDVFEGIFINDDISGDGYATLIKDGNKFTGNMKDGKEHGLGKLEYKNGDEYSGEFKFGLRHGIGTYTEKAGGLIMEGLFKQNELVDGKMILPDGVIIEGKMEKEYMDVEIRQAPQESEGNLKIEKIVGRFDRNLNPIGDVKYFDFDGEEILIRESENDEEGDI